MGIVREANVLQLVALSVKCLEGTTERSDDNRVRSARKGGAGTMCLEGTTPKDMHFIHRHRCTAFQAESLQQSSPSTSCPVIVASLRTAFQADNTLIILVRFQQTFSPFYISSFLLYSFPYPLYKLHFVADNVYSKALNMCSKVLNICSKVLNIRSKVLNKDFLGANKNLLAHNKNFLPYPENFYA